MQNIPICIDVQKNIISSAIIIKILAEDPNIHLLTKYHHKIYIIRAV